MNWVQIYQDMAFAPYKNDIADHRKLRYALTTPYCFMQGQAEGYEVTDWLGYLEQKFRAGVLTGYNLVRQSTKTENENERDQLSYEGMSLIERHLRKFQ